MYLSCPHRLGPNLVRVFFVDNKVQLGPPGKLLVCKPERRLPISRVIGNVNDCILTHLEPGKGSAQILALGGCKKIHYRLGCQGNTLCRGQLF